MHILLINVPELIILNVLKRYLFYRASRGGAERDRECEVGSELSAQSLMRGSNSQSPRS